MTKMSAGRLLSLAMALCLGACGGSSGGGGTGGNGGGASGSGGRSGGGSGGGGGGQNPATCAPAGSTCTPAETNSYNTCLENACNTQYTACYGPNYRNGVFAGSCGSSAYFQCITACGCNPSTSCILGCGTSIPAACVQCSLNLDACITDSACTRPACYGGGAGPDGGTPNFDGGLPGFDGSIPGFDGGFSGTCADLARCCGSITQTQVKALCQSQYDAARPSGDATCGAVYTVLRGSGICS